MPAFKFFVELRSGAKDLTGQQVRRDFGVYVLLLLFELGAA